MCGRASLSKTEKELEDRFKASFYSEDLERYNPLPTYNIAPTHFHPIITNEKPDFFQLFKWGLVPSWAKNEAIGSRLINARIETILEKPSFKKAIHKRRCVIPFDGFYEWKKITKKKIPYRICLKSEALFAVAGIWGSWYGTNGKTVNSFSIITQSPNQLMEEIHNRMPAILLPEQEKLWLDDSIPTKDLLTMIQPFPNDLLKAYPVSKQVNKVSFNDPSLFEVQKLPTDDQLSLF